MCLFIIIFTHSFTKPFVTLRLLNFAVLVLTSWSTRSMPFMVWLYRQMSALSLLMSVTLSRIGVRNVDCSRLLTTESWWPPAFLSLLSSSPLPVQTKKHTYSTLHRYTLKEVGPDSRKSLKCKTSSNLPILDAE